MRLSYLNSFLKIAETQNITLAARRLYLSQQAVSKQMTTLEKELGVRLFERTTPLRLTHAGNIVAQYANTMLHLQHDMMDALANATGMYQQALNIGVAHTRGKYLVSNLFTGFHRKYPEIQLNLFESCNSAVYQQLLNGQLDCVISRGTPVTPGIKTIPFFEEEVVLLLSESLLTQNFQESPIEATPIAEAFDLSRFCNCPFLLLKEGDLVRTISDLVFEQCGITPVVSAYAEHLDTLYVMCQEGLGAMFCPLKYLLTDAKAQSIPGMRYFFLPYDSARYTVNLSYPDNAYQNTALRAFLTEAGKLESVLPDRSTRLAAYPDNGPR